MPRLGFVPLIILVAKTIALAQWMDLRQVSVTHESSELAGPQVGVTYTLADAGVSGDAPAYVFVRYRSRPGAAWRLLPRQLLQGDGAGLVASAGPKQVVLWGSTHAHFAEVKQAEFRVRAV